MATFGNLNNAEDSGNTLAMSVNSALEKFRKVFLAVLVVFVVAIVAVIAGIVAYSKSVESGIEKIDAAAFALMNNTAELSGDELKGVQDNALGQLSELSSKGGVVGIRANMLLGDLYLQQGRFEESRDAWIRSAEISKKSYTNAVSLYNAAYCFEKLGDLVSAEDFYGRAADFPDFLLVDHALFSLGRVCEASGKSDSAVEAYQRLNDLHPNSSWAKMAKSRIISLKIGK